MISFDIFLSFFAEVELPIQQYNLLSFHRIHGWMSGDGFGKFSAAPSQHNTRYPPTSKPSLTLSQMRVLTGSAGLEIKLSFPCLLANATSNLKSNSAAHSSSIPLTGVNYLLLIFQFDVSCRNICSVQSFSVKFWLKAIFMRLKSHLHHYADFDSKLQS